MARTVGTVDGRGRHASPRRGLPPCRPSVYAVSVSIGFSKWSAEKVDHVYMLKVPLSM